MLRVPELAYKSGTAIKTLSAKKTKQRIIVIDWIFAMWTDIFSHLFFNC